MNSRGNGAGQRLGPVCWLLWGFTFLLVVGAVLLFVVLKVFTWVQDPADTGHYGLYLNTANWWAVFVGLCGIGHVTVRSRDRRWARFVGILVACDLGMLLAVLWPVELLLAAAAFAKWGRPWRDRRWPRWRWWRGAAALAGAGGAVAGALWGYTGYQADQPWRGAPTNLVFTGIWRSGDGGTL